MVLTKQRKFLMMKRYLFVVQKHREQISKHEGINGTSTGNSEEADQLTVSIK